MAETTIGKANRNQMPLKVQEQDNPTVNMGRFSLFRALMKQSSPSAKAVNPVSGSIASKLRSRKNDLDY